MGSYIFFLSVRGLKGEIGFFEETVKALMDFLFRVGLAIEFVLELRFGEK